MKLFHFGLYTDNEQQQTMRDALRDIADEYREFSWVHNIEKARVDFHRIMAEFNPDVVFMQVQTPDIIKGSSLVRYPGVKFFNFNGDVRDVIHPWHFDIAPYCTMLFSNKDWVRIMEAKGFKSIYFQIGFDHNIYKPDGSITETKPIVFMGNNHGGKFPLSKLRGDMVERFSTKSWFQVYGRGWKNGIDLNYKQQQEAAVYRGAKIGINLSHMDLDSYTSDRMFRIMGSGAMCLAYRHKGIEQEFNEDDQLIIWNTLDELEKKIEYFLNFEDRVYKISKAGCDHVHTNYTWPARILNDLIPLL